MPCVTGAPSGIGRAIRAALCICRIQSTNCPSLLLYKKKVRLSVSRQNRFAAGESAGHSIYGNSQLLIVNIEACTWHIEPDLTFDTSVRSIVPFGFVSWRSRKYYHDTMKCRSWGKPGRIPLTVHGCREQTIFLSSFFESRLAPWSNKHLKCLRHTLLEQEARVNNRWHVVLVWSQQDVQRWWRKMKDGFWSWLNDFYHFFVINQLYFWGPLWKKLTLLHSAPLLKRENNPRNSHCAKGLPKLFVINLTKMTCSMS